METLLDAPSGLFHDAYWKFRDAYDRGALNAPEYWGAVAAMLQRNLDQGTLSDLLRADIEHWTQPNVPMISWAQKLQQVGIRTGILSNIGDAMESGILARFQWMAAFNHCTFSHRLKIAKPDLAIYRYAAQGLQTSAKEILFIDDRDENIQAARAVGMLALQYSSHMKFVADLQGLGEIGLPLPE